MRRWVLVVAVWLIWVVAARADGPGAGFRGVQLKDPIGGKAMDAVVFYPSAAPTKALSLGPYRIDAAPEADLGAGRFPLILLSHGSAGSDLGHHDLATYLARKGFIVAAIEHPGDNYHDRSRLGTDAMLIGRSLQLSALLDALLVHPLFGEHIDTERIGAAGFSAGGYAVLTLVGARPNFSLWGGYCRAYVRDRNFCVGYRKLKITQPGLAFKPDSRVRAVFAMAPIGLFFDRVALAAVSVPVYLYTAQKDSILVPAENAERLRRNLPRPPEYTQIAGADHYVFLAPCASEQASSIPALCADAPGIDRRAIHARLNADAAAFFRRVFATHSAHLTGNRFSSVR